MEEAKSSKQISEEADEKLQAAQGRLKDELGNYANSLAEVANLQALAIKTMRTEFERDQEAVKQWLEDEEHDEVCYWLIKNWRSKRAPYRMLPAPLSDYSPVPEIKED